MRRFVVERSDVLPSAKSDPLEKDPPLSMKRAMSVKAPVGRNIESSLPKKRSYIRGLYETLDIRKGSKDKKSKPVRSTDSVNNLMESLLSDTEVKEDEKEQMFVQYDNFLSWCHDDDQLRRHNLLMVGDVLPGNFVGHVALMERMKHKVSVVATTVCCAYELSSTEISRLIRVEPSVAVQFQHALSSAIREQSNTWGKACVSQRKVTFVKNLKKQFYSIREGKMDDSSLCDYDPSLVTTPHKTLSNLGRLRRWKIHPFMPSMRNLARYNPKHSLTSLSSLASIGMTSSQSKLESVLSEARVLRDSDSEEEADLKSHKQDTGLLSPFRIADKKIFGVAKGISEMLKLRKRHQRKIFKCWSYSDLQRLEKTVDFSGNEKVLKAWSGGDEAKDSTVINKSESQFSRNRRQSFPSLENLEWKMNTSHLGLL
mmetsp:Transcript_23498/g.32153  ORF Transcript_23498/g.32153 Transcript_23498/m.32153 type:complete len:427 (+) Transcript_23498:3013-4293(+)